MPEIITLPGNNETFFHELMPFLKDTQYVQLMPDYTDEDKQIIKKYKDVGCKKNVFFQIRPLSGGDLYIKNQRFELIHDPISLEKSKYIFITNIPPTEKMEGYVLFDRELTISGNLSVINKFKLYSKNGSYHLRDEYDFHMLEVDEEYERIKIVS